MNILTTFILFVCIFALILLYFACKLTDFRRPVSEVTPPGRKVSYWKTTRGRKIGARITLTVMTLWILGVFIGALFVDIAPWNLFFVVFGVTLLGLIVIRTISKWIGFDITITPEDSKYTSKVLAVRAQAEALRNHDQKKDDDTPFFLS